MKLQDKPAANCSSCRLARKVERCNQPVALPTSRASPVHLEKRTCIRSLASRGTCRRSRFGDETVTLRNRSRWASGFLALKRAVGSPLAFCHRVPHPRSRHASSTSFSDLPSKRRPGVGRPLCRIEPAQLGWPDHRQRMLPTHPGPTVRRWRLVRGPSARRPSQPPGRPCPAP